MICRSSTCSFFIVDKLCFNVCTQVIHPSLDDIQQALNKATQSVLDVNRSVAQWGQKRFKMMEITSNGEASPGHIKRTVRATDSSELIDLPLYLLKLLHRFRGFKTIYNVSVSFRRNFTLPKKR